MVETLTSKDIINILNFINGYISKKIYKVVEINNTKEK